MRDGRRGRLIASGLTAAASGLAHAAAGAAATTYVNCEAPAAGADGSKQHPLTTLADASAEPLSLGAKLLLRRDTGCTGTLALTGAGSKARPALIGAYGRGRPPLIAASSEDGVRLENVSHATVEGLEIINPGDGMSKRRGVHLIAAGETARDLTVRDLHIHDIGGNLDKDTGGSGGIQVDSTGPGVGRFPRARDRGKPDRGRSRRGIFVVGVAGGDRPRASEPWPEASRGVRISPHQIRRIAGDGIVALGTDGARVRHNLVRRGNRAGRGLADPQGMICDAGIWAFHANNTVIEHNVVAGMKFNGCDGSGYDIDYDQDGTDVQFNESRGNEGGFMLLCTDDQPRTATVRFNLSVNDGFSFNGSPCSRPAGSYAGSRSQQHDRRPRPRLRHPRLPEHDPLRPARPRLLQQRPRRHRRRPHASICGPACRSNLFFRMPGGGADPVAAAAALPAPPSLRRRHAARAFKLRLRSPAIGAGARIPAGAAQDFFGNRIGQGGAPDIGFFQVR